MCDHGVLVRTSDAECACTACGRSFLDPPASEGFVVSEMSVSVGLRTAVDRVGSLLDATTAVRSTVTQLMVHVGGRSSNVNVLAACYYVAFRIHNLDRLEDELTSRVPGVTRRLFAKYLNKLRRQGLDVDADPRVSPVLRRMLSTPESSRRVVAARVRGAQETYENLRRVYGDTKTVPTLVRMAVKLSDPSS